MVWVFVFVLMGRRVCTLNADFPSALLPFYVCMSSVPHLTQNATKL
jgi:hypothetical protein